MTEDSTHNEPNQKSNDPTGSGTACEESTPVTRLVENIEAEACIKEAEFRNRKQSVYIYSPAARAFSRSQRRHKANIFNALFYDKEKITEADIAECVERASAFFGVPIPTMIDRCEYLAQITFSNYAELGSEIRYDIDKLADCGINNVEAFAATLTHELAHLFVADKQFNFCRNRSWCMELACDFIVGVRCAAASIASGKYMYAVSRTVTTETHPEARFRYEAVKSGFDFAKWLWTRHYEVTAENAMLGVTKFLCANSKALNESFDKLLASPPPQSSEKRDVMDLPDSNLIKKKYLKTINH